MQMIVKLVLTAGLIVLVSEVGKRSSFMGALLASLPLVSYLGMIWLYVDTKSTEKVAALSTDIFWLVLPSLPFFLLLATLLKRKVDFTPALAISTLVLIACYLLMTWILKMVVPTPTPPEG